MFLWERTIQPGRVRCNSRDKGLFICAAGNEETDNDLVPNYPSAMTLTISSLHATDALITCLILKLRKESVDIGAPGLISTHANTISTVRSRSGVTLLIHSLTGQFTGTGHLTAGISSPDRQVPGNSKQNRFESDAYAFNYLVKCPIKPGKSDKPDYLIPGFRWLVLNQHSLLKPTDNFSWTRLEYDVQPVHPHDMVIP